MQSSQRRGSRSRTHDPNLNPSATTSNQFDEDALDDIRRYEDFTTTDWIVDSNRERQRVAREKGRDLNSNSHLATNSNSLDASGENGGGEWGSLGYASGERPPRWWPMGNVWGRRAWLIVRIGRGALRAATDSGVVIIVGILIGLNMAVISIATEWASDLKQGYCSAGWWLNQKFCCWEVLESSGPGGSPSPPASLKNPTPIILNPGETTVTNNVTSRGMELAIDGFHEIFKRAMPLLNSRANESNPGSGMSSDLSETCPDWVPWSTWTLPAWIIYVIFAALLSAACAHLVRGFAPYAAGSGISEIKCILAGFIINGYLGAWTFAIKSLTLPLAIASGLSVGKEGPAVHVACCIGNIVANFFRSFNQSQARMRELLTAASAAGVAVAFGSPIGGVLFSLEEMSFNFPSTTMWRSFLCALAATVSLSFMNPFRTGKLVLFQVSYDRDWHYFEIFFYIIIGIFGGLYGAFVIKYNLQVQNFRRNNLAAHGVSEAVTLAVLTAFVGYFNMFLRIDMTESLEILFRECEGGGDYDNLCQSWAQWRMVNSLLLATVLRTALVIISYGCKVPAGIFVPSMAIGATFGRLVGILVKALYNANPNSSFFSACDPDVPCITPGTYAFLGAAAALAGVTRITVAVVVIMFELTGALTYILPTMLVIGITKGIGDFWGKGGISEQMIKFQGYPFLDKEDHVFGIPVSGVMKLKPDVLCADGEPLKDLEAKLGRGLYKGLPVVAGKEDHTLLGYIGKRELRYALAKVRKSKSFPPDVKCLFTCSTDLHGLSNFAEPSPMMNTPVLFEEHDTERGRRRNRTMEEEAGLMPEEDDEDEEDLGSKGDASMASEGVKEDTLELGAWVDQNPLIVQPSMPLETVMDLFKKMGPRVILVSLRGSLVGLVTVKDVLKHVAAQERAEHAAAEAVRDGRRGPGLPTIGTGPSSTGIQADLDAFSGELELMLNDAWSWAKERGDRLARMSAPLLNRLGLRRAAARASGSSGGFPMRSTGRRDQNSSSSYSQVEQESDSIDHHRSETEDTAQETRQFVLGDEN